MESYWLQRDRDGSEYALPGGHVKIGETTADGLVREYKEETGADIKVGKLLWTEDCFWDQLVGYVKHINAGNGTVPAP